MTSKSQVASLAQVLMDSIGPRLTGSPAHQAAIDWVASKYQAWGIPVRKEQYGTWRSWRRGTTHVDLIAPRVRTLEATMLAWSPGTSGTIEGEVVLAPEVADSAEFRRWLATARGKFILNEPGEPTCRPNENLERLARPETVERLKAERLAARQAWSRRTRNYPRGALREVEAAGVGGILTGYWFRPGSNWEPGWGVSKVFDADTETIPSIQFTCEDYGLLFRLASNGQGPRIRVTVESEALGDVPVFNVVGELRGTGLPDEYVLLGAHLDSWDGASGATDNGTGSVMMLEAMRLLKAAYPNPRRTILVGHWGGEEQGLIGSRAFAVDHPEVVSGLQAAFNQDNGTWRVEYIRMMGLTGAGPFFQRWMARIPESISGGITLDIPGVPETGGSDHMSFLCEGAPSFRLQSHYPDYRQYTWHTDRDTYDKLILDDLRNNATLAAMLAYLASEDPERIPRDRATTTPEGRPLSWPRCPAARRSWR